MARLRFETANDLLEAFPGAAEILMIEPADTPSLAFLQDLVEQSVDKAVGFCAYLLPRRDAVWWACQSVRTLRTPQSDDEQKALRAAEDWVREPEVTLRIAALQIGRTSNSQKPASWLALAAGWAGATMPVDDKWAAVPPDQTAKAVRAAILIAASNMDPEKRSELLKGCITAGAQLASDPTVAQ